MDAFQSVVAQIFSELGYWTEIDFKVELTKDEKRAIDRPSSPRWEIDVIAYKPRSNQLLAIECKSYLDSHGVAVADLFADGRYASRYKLLTEDKIWPVVRGRLVRQLYDQERIAADPSVRLCLAAGKVYDLENEVKDRLSAIDVDFYGPSWLKGRLEEFASRGYANEIAVVVAKILRRAT
jgi:hypothetical protein